MLKAVRMGIQIAQARVRITIYGTTHPNEARLPAGTLDGFTRIDAAVSMVVKDRIHFAPAVPSRELIYEPAKVRSRQSKNSGWHENSPTLFQKAPTLGQRKMLNDFLAEYRVHSGIVERQGLPKF